MLTQASCAQVITNYLRPLAVTLSGPKRDLSPQIALARGMKIVALPHIASDNADTLQDTLRHHYNARKVPCQAHLEQLRRGLLRKFHEGL